MNIPIMTWRSLALKQLRERGKGDTLLVGEMDANWDMPPHRMVKEHNY